MTMSDIRNKKKTVHNQAYTKQKGTKMTTTWGTHTTAQHSRIPHARTHTHTHTHTQCFSLA